MARKPAELAPIMTRIPERLRSRLEQEAARQGRSMNSEIIHRLERTFAREDFFTETLARAFGQGIAEILRAASMHAGAFFQNPKPGGGLLFWRDDRSQLRFKLYARLTDEKVAGLGEDRTVQVEREEKK